MNRVKAIAALALTAFWSCSANPAHQDAANKRGNENLREKHTANKKSNKTFQEKQAEIIRGTKVSKTGEQLGYEFDNSANTMRVFFSKDTAVLNGEQMASGIKYSNKVYTYTESQGNSTLFKNGVIVFEGTSSK